MEFPNELECRSSLSNTSSRQGRKAAVVIRWGIQFFSFCSPRSWIWISFGTATRPRFLILDFSALSPWRRISFGTATRPRFSILDFSAPRPWSQIFFTTASRRRKKNTLRLLVVESNTASRWRTPRAGSENQNYFSMLENFQKHFRI